MKHLITYFWGIFEDILEFLKEHPSISISMLIILYIVAALQIDDFLSNYFPTSVINDIVVLPFFVLTGILGIVVILTKEAPVFIIPITGKPAVILGVIILIGSIILITQALIIKISR